MTEEEKKLAVELSAQLDEIKEINEWASYEIKSIDTEQKKITFEFEYDDPEGNGETLFFIY